MKIWVFTDSMDDWGKGSIKGIYETEEKAKIAIAEYVLTQEEYLELFEVEVE